jgi:hypothetical protein
MFINVADRNLPYFYSDVLRCDVYFQKTHPLGPYFT